MAHHYVVVVVLNIMYVCAIDTFVISEFCFRNCLYGNIKAICNKLMHTLRAVSYTHLFVSSISICINQLLADLMEFELVFKNECHYT